MFRIESVVSLLALLCCSVALSGEVPEGLRLVKEMNQQMQGQQWEQAQKTAERALVASRKEYKAALAAGDVKAANSACIRIASVFISRGLMGKMQGGRLEDLDKAFAGASGELDEHITDPKAIAVFRLMLLPSIVSAYLDLDEYARAEPYSQKLVDAANLMKGKSSVAYATMAAQHGMILHFQGKNAAADPFLTMAVSVLEKAPGTQAGQLIHVLLIHGMVKLGRKQYAQSEALLKNALTRAETAGDDHGVAAVTETLVEVLEAQGKKIEAEKHKKRSAALKKKLQKEGQ